MRIETYFLSDKKEIDGEEVPLIIFEVLYQTVFPVAMVWLFFQTQIPYFIIPVILPIFLKIKIRKKRVKNIKWKG